MSRTTELIRMGAATGMGEELGRYVSTMRELVECALDRLMPSAEQEPAKLHEAMRHSVFGGGKRLRPVLTLAAHELLTGTAERALVPACAVELIHTYSLVHDDLPEMDDDDTRRGRPTCHKVYGSGIAVLAGDALLTLAFDMVSGDDCLDHEVRVGVMAEMARANGSAGMIGGQAADLEAEWSTPSLDAVNYIHTHKTALPMRAAVKIGAITAGASKEDIETLARYGEGIGLAFQITDDLLDLTGTADSMGKAVGKDDQRGKLTYPSACGPEAAAARAADLVDGAVGEIARFGEKAWVLRDLARFIVARTY